MLVQTGSGAEGKRSPGFAKGSFGTSPDFEEPLSEDELEEGGDENSRIRC